MAKRSYKQRKAAARQAAMDWQSEFCEKNLYYSELHEAGTRFERIGKRYGLLREFRENGIPC